ncbi:MAG: nicotinamide-nucleotide amidohydrolase family protein [Deltaproteobacteria bacterium]|nr:nicotinamide-nucleotide amidohydrolase family protein [Deltaproteobacteria bacterium]
MKAEIITIGDELMRGEIIDSNKARLAQRLLLLDLDCRHQVSVLDDRADMRDAFLRAADRSDLVLVSGGLGPTRDDLTTEVLAETFGRKLELDPPSLAAIEAFFARVGREMADVNRKQAYFPTGAEVLENPIGTAPGFALAVPRANGANGVKGGRREAVFFAMPGVPRELDKMMDEQVMPQIERLLSPVGEADGLGPQRLSPVGETDRLGPQRLSPVGETDRLGPQHLSPVGEADGLEPRRVVRAALLRTFGMGESTLEAELRDLARDGDVELGFRTAFPDNFLRPVARAASAAEADRRIAAVVAAIRAKLGPIVFGEGEESMEGVVGRLLVEAGKTVATAESCTGGLVAERLTDVPGSSRYFLGSVVAYSNEAKSSLLGVPAALIEGEGAVSEPVVRAMAEGARARFGSDFALATSGISGPDGGTATKPVGLVWIALAEAGGTHADSFVFSVDRSRHRSLTAQLALDWVRRRILGAPLVGPGLMRRAGGGSAPG